LVTRARIRIRRSGLGLGLGLGLDSDQHNRTLGLEALAEVDTSDPEEYLTELLDRSTDDGIAVVLRAAMSGT